MSKVVVITTSLRAKSNSDILAARLAEGAKDAGHSVECISLKGKEIKYCIGCLTCQKTQKCVIKDDVAEIAEKIKNAETVVFVTPIYYYEMSGQMKTLLDRLNPLYPTDYKFRNIYMLSTAAESEDFVPEK
ncbi:MAG: flavodoxin family protein, partial [Clostridia bacterium]|nr:flavodoxin family protein [Clostridia bacterium]